MTDSFVHLHNHTEYSMLDGAAKVSPLFAEAKRLGVEAVILSDAIEGEARDVALVHAAIAREIHDDVGGSLTALKFDLAWLGRHIDAPPQPMVGDTLTPRAQARSFGASERLAVAPGCAPVVVLALPRGGVRMT